MKLAVIADVHGNALALEAVLQDIAAQGIDEIFNLGDHLSGPLEAARTADMLMTYGLPSIRGDQDRRLLELHARGGSGRSDYQQLHTRHLDWLQSLPETLLLRDAIFLCHGSPRDDAAYWLDQVTPDGRIMATPVTALEAAADGIEANVILCGHTHFPRIVRLRDGRLIVNPGSVGCPGYTGRVPVAHKVEVGSPDARYAIVECLRGGWRASLHSVPYDHGTMAELARQRGAADWASALATGWID